MKYEPLDITTIERGVIAHQVNCQGKMGAGVAKAIKTKWPEVFAIYKKQGTGSQLLGSCHAITIIPLELYVCNVYGQDKFGSDSKQYTDEKALKKGLDTAFRVAEHYNLPLYLPKIGSKRGGMDWEKVAGIISELNNTYNTVSTTICEYEE